MGLSLAVDEMLNGQTRMAKTRYEGYRSKALLYNASTWKRCSDRKWWAYIGHVGPLLEDSTTGNPRPNAVARESVGASQEVLIIVVVVGKGRTVGGALRLGFVVLSGRRQPLR
jgi:hypothetical protein